MHFHSSGLSASISSKKMAPFLAYTWLFNLFYYSKEIASTINPQWLITNTFVLRKSFYLELKYCTDDAYKLLFTYAALKYLLKH